MKNKIKNLICGSLIAVGLGGAGHMLHQAYKHPVNVAHNKIKKTEIVCEYRKLKASYRPLVLSHVNIDKAQSKIEKMTEISNQYQELKNTPEIQKYLELEYEVNKKAAINYPIGMGGTVVAMFGVPGLIIASQRKKKLL